MKSLEILNSKIKQIKKDLYKLGETKEGTAEDFGRYYLTEELKDYQNVKQDLEVLEILKSKAVNIELLSTCIDYYKCINKYNYFEDDDRKLTNEELFKLMTWWVEQE